MLEITMIYQTTGGRAEHTRKHQWMKSRCEIVFWKSSNTYNSNINIGYIRYRNTRYNNACSTYSNTYTKFNTAYTLDTATPKPGIATPTTDTRKHPRLMLLTGFDPQAMSQAGLPGKGGEEVSLSWSVSLPTPSPSSVGIV
ncbi:hypothetical protein AOLI_G00101900 [Acnodon oligacanthus]